MPNAGTPAQASTAAAAAPGVAPTAAPPSVKGARALRVTGRGLLVALVVGVLGGLAARAWMRLFSLVLGHETGFSWPGTLGIVMMFTIFLIPGAIAAAATRRRWRWVPLALGVVVLWLMTVTVAGQEDLPTSYTGGQLVGVALVAIAFLLTPVAQAWGIVRLADRWRTSAG